MRKGLNGEDSERVKRVILVQFYPKMAQNSPILSYCVNNFALGNIIN